VIVAEFDASGLERALAELPARVALRAREGLDATAEAIAARARQTTTYKDVTGALRASTQNAGVEGSGEDLSAVVSFAARSSRGHLYGASLEFGTHAGARTRTKKQERREAGARFKGPRQRSGIQARKFIRDAIDAQDGSYLEAALGAALRDAGFIVRST
jgi:hypothetical protein